MGFECSATGEGPVFFTHGLDLPTGETLKFKSKKDMDDFRKGRPELSPDFVNEIVFDTPTPVQRRAIDDLYARSREQYQGSANISRTQILEALEKLK